jgi:hypothetical protein
VFTGGSQFQHRLLLFVHRQVDAIIGIGLNPIHPLS